MSPVELDKAFELIEEGNALESKGNYWKSAQSFGQAMTLLEKLAESSPSNTEEQEKIVELYRQKSRHYRATARESLIQALQKEKEQDSTSEDGTTLVSGISMKEAESRVDTFSLLFSRTVEDIGEKTNSLEERLMELNASLPSGFKTSKERMADINRGLGRLGLSLYPNSDHGSSTDVQPPLSEDEQIEHIIAQAKDEVRFNPPTTTVEDGKNATETPLDDGGSDDDSSTSDSEMSDDSVSLDDLVDDPVLDNHKAIRHKVVKAQVKLAELVALLNTEPDINLSEDADDNDNSKEEEGDKGGFDAKLVALLNTEPDINLSENADENDNRKEGGGGKTGFDVAYGRATLVAARNYLNKALKDWPESS